MEVFGEGFKLINSWAPPGLAKALEELTPDNFSGERERQLKFFSSPPDEELQHLSIYADVAAAEQSAAKAQSMAAAAESFLFATDPDTSCSSPSKNTPSTGTGSKNTGNGKSLISTALVHVYFRSYF